MANGFQSLPGSSGVYFVPKIWSHSMAGCPLQSALWKESEGRVRSEEMGGGGPEEEPNWLSWTSSILQQKRPQEKKLYNTGGGYDETQQESRQITGTSNKC